MIPVIIKSAFLKFFMANFDNSNNFSLPPFNSLKNEDFVANQLSKKKDIFSPKLQLAFITILAAVSLIFAAGNWLNSLKIGFAVKGNINGDFSDNDFSPTNSDISRALSQQSQDTDMDGLSDYDELNVYKTSPYIADSDSDGYLDGEEVKNGEDPNCPINQSCGLVAPAETDVSAEELNNLSAEQIRQILLKQGTVKEEDLANIDDQTLKNLYLETLNETGPQESGPAELKPEQNLELITPAQLRAILLEQPEVKPEDINSLTDAELMEVWQEILRTESAVSE